ncbi:MAG: hypothetical protein IJ399_01135 [Bacilli bacterium]|nr:hypothetical protein [Bacilli bacterium]
MKRIKIVLLIILICSLFISNISAEETIKIISIELEDISLNAKEIQSPTSEGLNIDTSLEFRELNSYAKYKVTIENNTDKDYFIENETYFTPSNYVKYNYYTENKIKANDTSIVYLTISYDKEVNEEEYNEGIYKEEKISSIKLLNEEGKPVTNPNTGTPLTIVNLILLALIMLVLTTILNKTKISTLSIVLLCILSLPHIISASEELKLNLGVKVFIQKGYSVDYVIEYENVLISYKELDRYDLTHSECIDIYLDEKSEETKYKLCSYGIIYKGNKKYVPGENVKIEEEILFRKTYNDLSRGCEIIDENIVCESYSIWDVKPDGYFYYKGDIEKYGYTYEENDIELMNFESEQDAELIYENEASILAPFKFTMPEHDVLFTPYEEPV